MVPETPVASILSPSFAIASALRNEPGPLSLVLVTVMVVAYAQIAVIKSSAVAMVLDVTTDMNLVFICLWLAMRKARQKTDIFPKKSLRHDKGDWLKWSKQTAHSAWARELRTT